MKIGNMGDKLFGDAGNVVLKNLFLLITLRGTIFKRFQGDINDSQSGSGNYRLYVGSCLHLVQELL
jgi:hypothetical protein